MLFMAVYS